MYFNNNEFDPKRMLIQFYTIKNNELSKLYQELDDYFKSDEFRFNYFKEFGYNKESENNFKFNYYPLFSPKEENDEYKRKYNNRYKYKLKFGVNKNKKIITTKIIIKDIKSNRMKEYENLKFEDFKKIENLMSQKNIIIQPLINIYNIYTNKPYGNHKKHIQYGILIKMKELTFYTNKFNNIIHNIFKDTIVDVKYYETDINKQIKKEEIKEENTKIIKVENENKIKQTQNYLTNILNICIFSFILILNDILFLYCYKNF